MTTVFITGGHSGIGLECSRQLAARGVHIILAGRSPEKMQSVADELRALADITVTTVELDTSSLASVRSAAATCAAMAERGEIEPLNAVLSNAGGRFDGAIKHSPEGFELTFATNCLGPFLLTELLLPLMSAHGRIVFTASGTHDPDTTDGKMAGKAVEPDAVTLATIGSNGSESLSAGKRYSTSKLCTVMYAYELGRRLERAGSSVSSIAYDPGSVPGTGFLRDMPRLVQWLATTSLFRWVLKRVGATTSTIAFSGAALADLAVDPRYTSASGTYFQAQEGELSQVRSSTTSYDQQRAQKLWNDSKLLVSLLPEEEHA